MRLFRRTEFDGLVVATPQDLAWREDSLRRRQENESTTDIPALPTSLTPIPAESAATVVPDLPTDAGVPSAAATSDGSSLLGLSLSLIPTAAAAAAASSTPSPAAAAASSAAPGGGGLGLGVGAGLGGLLGGASTPTAEPSTSVAPTSVAPEPTSEAPTSEAPTSVAPVVSVQPASGAIPPSNPPPASSEAPAATPPTTASEAAPSSVAPSAEPPAATPPAARSSSLIAPIEQSSSAAAVVPATSSSPTGVSVQTTAQVSSASVAPHVSSAASLKSSSATGQEVTLTSKDGTSQITYLSTIPPSAAADLSNPTLATSLITSVTKTGSVPGVTTETTGSGIVVTETLKPSNSMSAGTMAGVIVGAAAGGLIIAAVILFLVRKFIRAGRIAKAESPPSSPLLNALNPPLSPMPPLRIEVGMHQRMRSNESDFWVSGKGSSINEKEVEGHRYPMPVSPLPRLPESQREMDAGNGRTAVNGGFKFFPNMGRSGEGKEVMPRDF